MNLIHALKASTHTLIITRTTTTIMHTDADFHTIPGMDMAIRKSYGNIRNKYVDDKRRSLITVRLSVYRSYDYPLTVALKNLRAISYDNSR